MKVKSSLNPLFIFFMGLALPSLLSAQTTGKIAGKVIDTETGDPLAGANVIIRGVAKGAAAEGDGNYFILNVQPGVYDVEATMMGYTRMVQTDVRVRIDQTTYLAFNLQPSVIEGKEILVVAEQPLVDKYLTASRQAMSAEELANSFVTNVEEAIGTMQGVNIHGGIRGGFGLEVNYMLDGSSIRDGSSGTNYSSLNMSAIQEFEVLTGGFNAEYGQAHGAVVNVVSKTARDRMHGTLRYQMRPKGIYHWGGYMYGDSTFENRVVATTPEYWSDYQIPQWVQEQYPQWLEDPNTTPDSLMAYYRDVILNPPGSAVFKDYNQRWSQEIEGTFYGPIGEKLSYMLTGRFTKDAPNFPQQFEYNPEWHTEANLVYDLTSQSMLVLKAFHGGHDNSGPNRTLFHSSEDMRAAIGTWSPINEGFITGAYDGNKYYPWFGNHYQGTTNPEYLRVWGGNLNFKHTFNPSMMLEAKLSHFQFYRLGSRRNGGPPEEYGWSARALDPALVDSSAGIIPIPDEMYLGANGMGFSGPSYGLFNQEYSFNTNNSIDIDFLWQVNQANQLKAGFYGSSQYINRYVRNAHSYNGEVRLNDIIPNDYNPYEGAVYLQDKIETEGMIINAGVRLDYFNLNKWVSADPYDPLQIDEDTPGNLGQNVVSIGDIFERRGVNASDNRDGSLIKTATQYAVSPRIGISHPITETTVLHFMYGHFNQRPPWNKLGAYPSLLVGVLPYSSFPDLVDFPAEEPFEDSNGNGSWDDGEAYEDIDGDGKYDPDYFNNTDYGYHGMNYDQHWSFYGGNPALTFERTIQYEIGFDQAIGDNLRLEATLYYREAKNLTAIGFTSSTYANYGFQPDVGRVRMHPDVSHPTVYQSKTRAGAFRMWANNGHQDVRGLELTVNAKVLSFASLRIDYDLSFNKTGLYGPAMLYREIPGGAKFDSTVTMATGFRNTYYGGNNGNNHQAGNQNQYWHPNNTAKVAGNFFTPKNFGPKILGIHWLGDWNLNFQTTWAQGRRYTWYDPNEAVEGYRPPLNRRWKDQWNTNLGVNKGFSLSAGQRIVVSMKVKNLLNDKWLRLPGDLDRYHLEGELATLILGHGDYAEDVDNVWRWYELAQLPREIFFELRFEY